MTEDNRTKMLTLAVAAIDQGGEESIRVTELVTEAGLSAPSLYHHFGNREGLVIAAQVERYRRQLLADIALLETSISTCASAEEFERIITGMWTMVLAERRDSRWIRTNALGSAFARPELELAIARANDELVFEMVRVLQPFGEMGWFRSDIDLASALAWQHSVLLARTTVERGETLVDRDEWDRFTLDAFTRLFFGHPAVQLDRRGDRDG